MNFTKLIAIAADDINVPKLTPDQFLANALGIVYFAAVTIAVIVIIIAGFTFVTTGSDAAAVAKARNAILYTVIGLVIISAAFFITQFILGRFK